MYLPKKTKNYAQLSYDKRYFPLVTREEKYDIGTVFR